MRIESVDFTLGEEEHSSTVNPDQVMKGQDCEVFPKYPRTMGSLDAGDEQHGLCHSPNQPKTEIRPEILRVHTAKNLGKYPCDTLSSWNLG